MMRTSVDLPAPFGPAMPSISPGLRSRSTPASAIGRCRSACCSAADARCRRCGRRAHAARRLRELGEARGRAPPRRWSRRRGTAAARAARATAGRGPMLQLGQQQRAAQRADDRALAAGQAGAADDDGGEDREGAATGRCSGWTGLDEGEVEDAGDRREHAAEDEGEDLVACATGRRASVAATGLPPIAIRRKPNSERCSRSPTTTAMPIIQTHFDRELDASRSCAVRPMKKSSSPCGTVVARRRIGGIEGRGVA